jgi:hypothetical protein
MPTKNTLLIQVLSRLQPGECGVSDHALALALELRREHGINSGFVVLDSTGSSDPRFPVAHCTPAQLLSTCASMSPDGGTVLLQYSGYGFSPDGAPSALADAIAEVRTSGKFRLAVNFHEIFATSMPWRSAFWHSHRQREVARRLTKLSDVVITNTGFHAAWLRRNGKQSEITPLLRMPVFSNLGESTVPAPFAGRAPRMVVFGLAGTRHRSYESLSAFGPVMKRFAIDEILDIGPQFDAPAEVCGIAVRRMGLMPADDLADVLAHSRFGFVPHPAFCLTKAGIFAGLCAHGTITLLAKPFPGEVDGLKDGVHLVSSRTAKSAAAAGLDSCSRAAWEWYSDHRLAAQAETYSRHLPQPSAEKTIDVVGSAAGS